MTAVPDAARGERLVAFYTRRDIPPDQLWARLGETDLPNLFLAGDWVKLPFPAMLMEAAYSAGLVSANAILAREGLRQNAVQSVPLRGLLPPRRATSRQEAGSEEDRLSLADRPRGSTA